MPHLIVTEDARRGLNRCLQFLATKNARASSRAAMAIKDRLLRLQHSPDIGRPFDGEVDLRELVIPFGDTGYVALYRHIPSLDAVYILAFRHQKEAGY
ncbi:type II toxin-antitoxin system RelE/ParE family toxin [Pelagibacterium halotolerans]|uniref:type II toxin-antitoxin system RelE/ParE family toxin n=1 Tax=Pelagibacterium halotolerans TaxID=531813 RepID=UPI00384B12CF